MKKSRFLVPFLMALVMMLALCFTACTPMEQNPDDNDKDKEPTATLAITDGYFDGGYDPGNNNPKQIAVMRFHSKGEIFEGKQTFYFYVESSNQAMFGPMLGEYEIKDESVTKTIFADRAAQTAENAVGVETTAAKKLVLKYLNGETFYEMGYDSANNRLFGFDEADADSIGLRSYYCGYCYNQKNETIEEKGVALETFYATVGEVKNASIEIYHNGTYRDNKVTGEAAFDGTWTKSGNAYTLTPKSSTNKGGVLTVNSEGSTRASFVPTGGEIIEMGPMARTAVYTLTGKGSVTSGDYTMDVNYTLTLNDDYSAILASEVAGNTTSFNGEWVEPDDEAEANMVAVVTISGVDPFIVTKGSDDEGSYISATVLGVELKQEIEGEEEAVLLYELSAYSGYIKLDLYDNNTCEYIVNGAVSGTGTWRQDGAGMSGALVAGEQSLPFTVDNVGGTLSSTLGGQTMTMTPEYILTGKVSGYFDGYIAMYGTGLSLYVVEMPEAYGGTSVTKGTWTETAGVISAVFTVGEQSLTVNVTNTAGTLTAEVNGTTFTMDPEYILTGKVSGYFDAYIAMYGNGLSLYVVEMPEAYGGTSITKGTWTETDGAISAVFTVGEQSLTVDITNTDGTLAAEVNGTSFTGTVTSAE